MHIITVICATGGETRLVGGSTDREGRVEVCVGGPASRWRTVCTGSQELARGVCLRIGIESLVLEGDDHIIMIAIYLNQIAQLYTCRKHCGSN